MAAAEYQLEPSAAIVSETCDNDNNDADKQDTPKLLREWLIGWQELQQDSLAAFRDASERMMMQQETAFESVLAEEFRKQWRRLYELTAGMDLKHISPAHPHDHLEREEQGKNMDTVWSVINSLSERTEDVAARENGKKKQRKSHHHCLGHFRLAVGWDNSRVHKMTELLVKEERVVRTHTWLRERCQLIAHHFLFGSFVAMVILTNTVTIGVYAHDNMSQALVGGIKPPWSATTDFVYTPFYILEILVRIIADGRQFFYGPGSGWNYFDCFVVGSTIVEIAYDMGSSFGFLRILRIFRILRVLRVLRLFGVFRELRLMVISIVSTLRTLLWAFVLLFVLMYCFAIVFVQAAADYLHTNESPDSSIVTGLRKYYSSVLVTMQTLLLSISGGTDWHTCSLPMRDIGPEYGAIFAFYIIFVCFGVLNVLTGVFVDSANQISKFDDDLFVQTKMRETESLTNQIEALFRDIDVDGSGILTWEEVREHLEDPRVQAYFGEVGIDFVEAEGLFQLLDTDGSGQVPIEEFVLGCMRLKGAAKSIDVATCMYENKKAAHQLRESFEHLHEELDVIKTMLMRKDYASKHGAMLSSSNLSLQASNLSLDNLPAKEGQRVVVDLDRVQASAPFELGTWRFGADDSQPNPGKANAAA